MNENNLIDRADHLMKRRVFVASHSKTELEGHPRHSDDHDIPVLTEIVDINEVTSDAPHHAQPLFTAPLIEGVAHAFSKQLHQRFAEELPHLINRASEQLALELQQAVHRITEESFHLFMSQQRQLALPIEDIAKAAHKVPAPEQPGNV